MSTRVILKPGEKVRVVIADDSRLIYSDDYRDGWRDGFESIGCDVSVVNITPLKGLARISNSSTIVSMRSYHPKSLGKTIARMHPHIVLFHHGRMGSVDAFLAEIRKGGGRTAVYLCDEPYETGETACYSPKYDYVFTMDPCTMEVHRLSRQNRRNVFYLPPAANVRRFQYKPYFKDGRLIRGTPAFFLGNATLIPRDKWLRPIHRTVDRADIRFWRPTGKGHKDWIPLEAHAHHYSNCVVGLNVHRAPWMDKKCYLTRVKRRPRGIATPPAGLQIHTGSPKQGWGTGFWNEGNLPAAHWNPRFIEMGACGTLVVSDNHRTEMQREFPYVPQAEDPAHFLELVDYYIRHPGRAEEIGKACSRHILARHTYPHRAAEILIRMGFEASLPASVVSCLGRPQDWLTPQDFELLTAKSFSGQTGLSERWTPPSGSSSIRTCISQSATDSTEPPTPWLL